MMKTKRNFKRVISLLLAILMATSTLAGLNLTAFAYTKTSGNFDDFSDKGAENCKWSYNSSTQTITIEPIDSSKDATMPKFFYQMTYDDQKKEFVESFDCPWSTINGFKYTVSKAVIKSGVTNIGGSAFYKCSNLKTIDLSGLTSLTSIDDNAFQSTGITSITIPANVKTIGWCAFYQCSSLSVVDLSGATSLTTIGNTAFEHTAITSITIPSTVETIGASAFDGCESLETVDLSGATSLKTIGTENAFGANTFNGTAITSITIPSNVETIGSYTFKSCSKLKKVTIYNKDADIGDDAFESCLSDLVVTAPAGGKVQQYCTDNKITFEALEVITADGTCGNNCSWKLNDQGTLTIYPTDPENDATMTDYSNSSNTPWNNNKDDIKKVVITDKVTKIGKNAFSGCSNLTTVDLSKATSLTLIGERAFAHTAITSITIPSTVETIGEYAFGWCDSLSKVDLSNATKLITIGEGAFGSAAIETITIPENVITIDSYAFYSCKNLTDIIIMNKDAKLNCYSIMENDGKTTVYSYAGGDVETYCKNNCIDFKEIENIVDSGDCGDNCLWRLSSKGTLTVYPTDAKQDATMDNYTSSSNTPWGKNNHLSDIKSVVIKDKVTNIGDYALSSTAITSIKIPVTVTSIGDNAFDSCDKLTDVTILNKDATLGNDCILSNEDLTVHGYAGSTAQAYCTTNSIDFDDVLVSGICGDNCSWKLDSKGTLTIYATNDSNAIMDNYDRNSDDLKLAPWTIYQADIKSVVIKENVTNIGDYAFFGFVSIDKADYENLATVDLSNATSLKTIGKFAFIADIAISTIDLSKATKLETIDTYAFYICNKLTDITISNKDTVLGDNCMPENSELTIHGYKDSTTQTYCTDNNIKFQAFADYDAYSSVLKQCTDKQAEENYETKYTEESRTALDTAVDKYSNKSNTETYIDIDNLKADQTVVDAATAELQTALESMQLSSAKVRFIVNLDDTTLYDSNKDQDFDEDYQIGSIYKADNSKYNGYCVTKWTIEENGTVQKINTDAPDFYYTVNNDITVTAYVTANKKATESTTKVTYLSRNASILDVKYVTNGEAVDYASVTAPTVSFYTFKEWKVVSGNPSNPDGKDIVLRAIYDIDGDDEANYTNVHCLGNVKANGKTDLKIFYDKCVALTGSSKDAKFAYVTADGETVLSAIQGNIIYAPHSKDVYIKEVTEQNASTTITGMYSNKEGTNNHFTMNCMAFVPEDATMVECGIIATVRDDVASGDNFVIGTDKVNKFTSPTQSKAGEFSMEFVGDFTGTDFTNFYCRSFVTYKQNGAEHTVYSNVSSAQVQ